MASLSWSITNDSAMQQLKSAKASCCYRSETFTAFGHRWYLRLYPNGTKSQHMGNTQLFLYPCALSPKVKSLKIRRKLALKSVAKQQKVPTAFKSHESVYTLSHDELYATTWPVGTVLLSDIQKLDRLTFTVDFDLIGALDRDDNSILGEFKDNRAKTIKKSICGIDIFPTALTWRITDESLLKRIKCAKMGSRFFSPIFEAFGHKWYLQFYPNGDDEDSRSSAYIYLYTTALSSNIKAMRVCRKLTFVEGDVSQILRDTLTPKKDHVNSWAGADALKTRDLAKHSQLTFHVEFDLYGVFDENDNDIVSHFKDDDEKQLNLSVANVHQPKASYTWSITDQSKLQQIKAAKVGGRFQSPTFTAFAHEWYLQLQPNGIDAENEGNLVLYLYVDALSPKIKSMHIRSIQRFLEGNLTIGYDRIINRRNEHIGWSWHGLVKLSEILDLDQLTFTVDFDVLEAVDHDGNDITAKWFAVEEQSQRKALEDKLIAAQKETESVRKQLEMEQKANAEVERDIPESFLCPITHRVMRDPVLAFDGRSYEREAIEEYLKNHNKSPVTGAQAITSMVFPNHDLHSRIIAFIEAQEMASEEQQSKEGEGETALE